MIRLSLTPARSRVGEADFDSTPWAYSGVLASAMDASINNDTQAFAIFILPLLSAIFGPLSAAFRRVFYEPTR